MRARLRRLRGEERGYSLIELVVVMLILGIVISGLTTVFVSGSNAELDMNRRFQAQEQARLALDKIRGDIHCGTSATSGSSAAQAATINTYQALRINTTSCNAGTTTYVYWCVVPVTTTPVRYALYRTQSTAAPTSSTCTASDTSRQLVADYLINNAAFTTGTIPYQALQTVDVDFEVDVNPTTTTKDVYELKDSIVARDYVFNYSTPMKYCGTTGGCAVGSVP